MLLQRRPSRTRVRSPIPGRRVPGTEQTTDATLGRAIPRRPVSLRPGNRWRSGGGLGRELRGGLGVGGDGALQRSQEIGRASCRERVEISVVAGSLKKK